MADKRECYAGDLTSDVLGKVAKVRVDGLTVVEDVVINVEHSTGIHGKPVTYIAFENLIGRSHSLRPGSSSFIVDHDVPVEVLS